MKTVTDKIGNETPDLTGYTRIAHNQKVGDGFYCWHLRDLYENAEGHRISVAVSPLQDDGVEVTP